MLFSMVSITEKDKKPEFICIVRVKFKPARGCAYIYILSKLQSPAFIHFKVQFFAVFRRSQYWTIPLCIRGWWRKTEVAISRKKKTVTWGEVRQLFFTMITKKPKRKTYVSRVTRVQSDSHGHTLVTIMNSPLVVLFSNVHQISFWKD